MAKAKSKAARLPTSLFPDRNVALLVAGRCLAIDPLLHAATLVELHALCAAQRGVRCISPAFLPTRNMLAYEQVLALPPREIRIHSPIVIGCELELVASRKATTPARNGFAFGNCATQVGRAWRVEALREAQRAAVLDKAFWATVDKILRGADLDPRWLQSENRLLVVAGGECEAVVSYGAIYDATGTYSWFRDDDGKPWNGKLPMGHAVARVANGAEAVELDVSARAHEARDRGYRVDCREAAGSESASYMKADAGAYCLYVANLG